MIHFECDYACGAHPAVLEALVKSNEEQHCGYSEDERCAAAAEMIQQHTAARFMDLTFAF